MTCVCLCVCVCARRRVGAGMGVVGAGGGSTDTLHGTGYDSGHQPRAHVMLAECRWAGRSEVCLGRDSSMFVRGTCLRAPAHVSFRARSSRAHTLAYLSLHDTHTSHTHEKHTQPRPRPAPAARLLLAACTRAPVQGSFLHTPLPSHPYAAPPALSTRFTTLPHTHALSPPQPLSPTLL